MRVWVISLELDCEGSTVYEIWKSKYKATKRTAYLNKNIAGVFEKFVMHKDRIRGINSK